MNERRFGLRAASGLSLFLTVAVFALNSCGSITWTLREMKTFSTASGESASRRMCATESGMTTRRTPTPFTRRGRKALLAMRTTGTPSMERGRTMTRSDTLWPRRFLYSCKSTSTMA